jgi:uncharacterized protein (DUF885 family)
MKWTCAFFLLLAACTSARPAPTKEGDLEARRKQLAGLISEQWEYTLRTSPEFASILGDLRYNDRLSDVTEKAVFADLEQSRQFAARFSAIDTTGFPQQEALNKTLMLRRLERKLEGAVFENWLMPVTQFYGLHIQAPQLVSLLRFETVKDYDDYLARLGALPKVLDDTTALMRKGMDKKLIPPRFLLEKVARQAEAPPALEPGRDRRAGRDGSLHRHPRAGAGIQDRPTQDPRIARQGEAGAGTRLRPARLP